MERRHFLKFALGLAAGAAAFAASAQAAPLMPQPLVEPPAGNRDVHRAVTSGEEIDQLKPEQVRWGHGHGWHHGWGHRHWGWHHRHWGWRRRHWAWHRHWGWRHRHWGWRHRHRHYWG